MFYVLITILPFLGFIGCSFLFYGAYGAVGRHNKSKKSRVYVVDGGDDLLTLKDMSVRGIDEYTASPSRVEKKKTKISSRDKTPRYHSVWQMGSHKG
jgi:hypothetical protein